jgi:hypothetical protein
MQGVIDILVAQVKGDNLPAVGVNANVKLSPSAAFGRPVLFKQPFASATQFSPVLSTIK